MLFDALENQLVELTQSITGIQNVQLWSGKPEDLLRKPHTYPAIRIVLEEHKLEPVSLEGAGFISTFSLSLLVFFRSLRDKGEGAYPIIESLYHLNSYEVNGHRLTPAGAKLLLSETGEFVYQVSFNAVGRAVIYPDEREVLVKKITLEDDETHEQKIVKKEG